MILGHNHDSYGSQWQERTVDWCRVTKGEKRKLEKQYNLQHEADEEVQHSTSLFVCTAAALPFGVLHFVYNVSAYTECKSSLVLESRECPRLWLCRETGLATHITLPPSAG